MRSKRTSAQDLFEDGDTLPSSTPPDPQESTAAKLALTLEDYPEDILLALRAEIDAALPPARLSAMNLEEELVLQFKTAKALQTITLGEATTEANKKAQVVNTTAATLQALVKMQADFYTAERFKRIELLLIETLRTLPQDAVADFFERYERELGRVDDEQGDHE